jgi:hypothetical protein
MQELDLKIFGKRLKKIGKERFGSVGNLGEKSDINNISNYTTGFREPGLRLINKLYQAGIDINELLSDKDKGEGNSSMDLNNVKTKSGTIANTRDSNNVMNHNAGFSSGHESTDYFNEIIVGKDKLIESQEEMIKQLNKIILLLEREK